MLNSDFWKAVAGSWRSIQTVDEKNKTMSFAETLVMRAEQGSQTKVPSIFEELFTEEEDE